MPSTKPVRPPREVVVRRRMGKEVERRGSKSRADGGSRVAAKSGGMGGRVDAIVRR